MRAFVAVPVGALAVPRLEKALAALPAPEWRPVAPGLRHVTLHFLGDRPERELEELADRLRARVARVPAFDLELRGLGTFPGPRRPDVLWAGCGTGAVALQALARLVEGALDAGGTPSPNGPFTPHVTLARRRRGADADGSAQAVASLLAAWSQTPWGRVRVDAAALFRSDLGSSGPRYTELAAWRLAREGDVAIP